MSLLDVRIVLRKYSSIKLKKQGENFPLCMKISSYPYSKHQYYPTAWQCNQKPMIALAKVELPTKLIMFFFME